MKARAQLAAILCAAACGGVAAPAHAHKPSDSYLAIDVAADGAVAGHWDIALRDLDAVLQLDADGDGRITWGEVRARHAEIAAYAMTRLALQADGRPCQAAAGVQAVDEHSDGAYTVLPLRWDCGVGAPAALTVDYRLFADVDPQHRGLLKLTTAAAAGGAAGATRAAVLGPHAPQQRFELAPAGASPLADYLREGVRHIAIGYDHILFLLALLLPAVVRRDTLAARWLPEERFAPPLWDVLRIVTAFTVAHSITLSLAVLGFVELPSRLVESTIAASVVLAALNNVFPAVRRRRWTVAFGFGLVHGFGFASVLADLGLPSGALALALLGFNLGVEVGQLAIVAVFLPLAWALRRTGFYRRVVLVGGSLAIAALAAAWFAERAFGLALLPA